MKFTARSLFVSGLAPANLALVILCACTADPGATLPGESEISAALTEPPTDDMVVQNPETAVVTAGRQIVTLLKQRGDIPASAKIMFQGDPKFNERVGARSQYESAIQTHVVYIQNATFDQIRKRNVSLASVAVMLCHELGHWFANGKAVTNAESTRSEGEADYFAMSTCVMPSISAKVFRVDPIAQALNSELTQGLKFRGSRSLTVSEQGALASAKRLLEVGSAPVSLLRTERFEATTSLTRGQYPSEQCRMDTYIAGIVGAHRPGCWAPAKCASVAGGARSPYSYRVTADDKMVVQGGDGRVVAELPATPKKGSASVLNGQSVRLYFDARSGTGAGLFVYTKDGSAFLAHDGVDKQIPLTCRPEALQ